jgi:hypothetical protein
MIPGGRRSRSEARYARYLVLCSRDSMERNCTWLADLRCCRPVTPFAISPLWLRSDAFSGDQPMRVLAILALALLLTGCEGDRIKNGSMNERQAQPQSTVVT